MYSLNDREPYFKKVCIEEYHYDENFKGIVAVAYFNDGEKIPLVDQISVKLKQVSEEENEYIVSRVNELFN